MVPSPIVLLHNSLPYFMCMTISEESWAFPQSSFDCLQDAKERVLAMNGGKV